MAPNPTAPHPGQGPPPRLPLAGLSPLPCSGLCGLLGTHRQHRKWVGGPPADPALSTPAARLSWHDTELHSVSLTVSSLVLSPGPNCRLCLVPQIYGAAFTGRPAVGGCGPHPPRACTWLEERCINRRPLQGLPSHSEKPLSGLPWWPSGEDFTFQRKERGFESWSRN